MLTQNIDIKTPDGHCDSFVAYPSKEGKYPAVLLLMDAFGPRPYLYSMAEKIASHGSGYYVLVPNLFYRIKRAPIVDGKFPLKAEDLPVMMKQIMSLFEQFSIEDAVKDIGVFLEFFSQQKQIRPGKIAITGYCLGGRLGILAAAQYSDQIASIASFHGSNLATEKPDSPHKLLGQIKAEIYIANADNDKSMPAEQIERLRSALDQSRLRYEMETYGGAAHGFTMADLPAYSEGALKKHWDKLFPLLERSFL